MMTTLSLDIGKQTGWAVSNGKCGTCDLRLCEEWGHLCFVFNEWLDQAIAHHRVDHLVVERAFRIPGQEGDLVAGLTCIAHMLAWKWGLPRSEATARTVRKATIGRGNAKPPEVLEAVRKWGWSPENDHEADAITLLTYEMERQAAREAG